MTQLTRQVVAKDGLRARDNGEWGIDKLEFLSEYGPIALKATQGKRTRHYLDLFAGPGVNVVRGGAREFEGSPLRALEIHAPGDSRIHFTDAWFVNRDRRDCEALESRVARRASERRLLLDVANVHLIRGDANEHVDEVMSAIHKRAYVFVFADMEAPRQFPWRSVEALKRMGHESVDLYMLFPLDMALMRLISKNPATRAAAEPVLTAFFGTDEWHDLIPLREINSEGARAELGRQVLALYLRQLKRLWREADAILDVRRGMSHRLYKMLFATSSDAAVRISRWAKRRAAQQAELF